MLNEKELAFLKKLWMGAEIRMQAMGRILAGKKEGGVQKTSLSFGDLELNIEKKDKDGNIVHTQNIKTDGKGKILKNKTWNKGGKING